MATRPAEPHDDYDPISHKDLNSELSDKEKQGATVHTFNSNDSPEKKAQQILSGANGAQSLKPVDMTALKAVSSNPEQLQAQKAPVAQNGKTDEVKIADAKSGKEELEPEKLEALKDEGRIDEEGVKHPAGAMPPPGVKPREIPSWFAIGWTGQDQTLFTTPDEARARTILSDFVSEAYYGEWYHNAGIIIFAVVSTHFLTLFGAGWAWLVIVLAFTATYYQTSIKRTRRNARDDMAREVAKKGLKADVESATWLNLFMTRFWIIYEPVLSATIVASVDQVLSVSTPAFLDSIRMTTFTLGTKPPHIDHVRTFADTEEDVVMMEWAISFTPNDVQDMTHAQSAKKINPKIVLNIRFGVGPASVGKDIVVEDLAFKGIMRIRMKLMNNFPHVQLVDLSFNSPPEFDFVLKPVGFDLSIIPGLTPFIFSQVHAILGPMMYSPNVFTLNLEQLLSGAPLDTAVGVLALTIHNGRGLRGTKLGGGSPDPYVALSVSGRVDLAKTAVKRATVAPRWNETKYIVLNTLNDVLTLAVRDWNEHRPDSQLGAVNFDLKSLIEDGQQEGKMGEVLLDGKPRGVINYDAIYYPVLTPKKLDDGTVELIPATKTGVVRLIIHQAKDLDPRGQQINPYATVLLNEQVVHRSQTLKRTPSPIWERPAEFLVTEKSTAYVSVRIYDENSLSNDTSLGTFRIKLDDLFDANAKGQDWFQLSGVKSGRVRLTAEWKPVLMAGAAINGSSSYTPPIGIIRLWFKRARDLKNVEALTGGKSDPYARVLFYGIVVARTMIINNNLDPEWDEIVYIQVHSPNDNYVVEVMDYEHLGKDRSLGLTRINVGSLVKEGPDKLTKPWASTGRASFNEGLKADGKTSVKGSIEFEAEFFPCAHLKHISFNEPGAENSITEVAEEEEGVAEKLPASSSNGSTLSVATPPTAEANGTPVVAVNGSTASQLAKEEKKKALEEGITVGREELLRTQSGILVFQIISGQFARKGARLEVLFDDGYWPTYSTEPARSPHAKFDEIGEVFVRELDFATIHFKLNTAEKETREDIVAAASIDMNVFLENCLDKPYSFTLSDPNGGSRSVISIAAKYIPVEIELLPRESVNNSGQLRVDLLDAKDLPAADRSGKSDPYAVFLLNGVKVHKSEVHKKTLAPIFNETFETAIASRVAANFVLEIYDWDRLGSPTKLGRGSIDLAMLEPMEQAELAVSLSDSKTGKAGGTVRLKLVFRPGFLAKSRAATSTLGVAGRVATSLGGGVIGVGSGVVGVGVSGLGSVGKGVGKGVLGGIGGVRRLVPGGNGGQSNGQANTLSSSDTPPVPEVPADFANDVSTPVSVGNRPAPPSPTGTPSKSRGGTNGILTVHVEQVQGFGDAHSSEKKFVSIRKGGKEVDHTHSTKGDPCVFNEDFKIPTVEGPCVLEFAVVHKKFAGSSTIGSGLLDVWEAISISSPTKDVSLVVGEGTLTLSLSWADSDSGSMAPSQRTKSRFSTISARSNRRGDTPEP